MVSDPNSNVGVVKAAQVLILVVLDYGLWHLTQEEYEKISTLS